MPGPTLRFTEGDQVRIKFINKTPIPHTLHLHGNHDDVNDGVLPQVMPGNSYTYNITAGPVGALMYHCHAMPTSLHIRMGMYGAMIIDPKDTTLKPAREFVMVMSEFDARDPMRFEAEYYPINGYADQYFKNPLQAKQNELVRMYIINIGTTIPYQFHLHSTIFKAYPSGLLSNQPIDAQTMPIGPGDAIIVEAKWKYPGTYLFHSHGLQEERGNMGQIRVLSDDNNNNNNTSSTESDSSPLRITTTSTPDNLTTANSTTTTNSTNKSISMIDWQYQLQYKLQNPRLINYTMQELTGQASSMNNNSTTTMMNHSAMSPSENPPVNNNNNSFTNETTTAATTTTATTISIVEGASNPNNAKYFDPPSVTLSKGSTVVWVNKDSLPHTATAGSDSAQISGSSPLFDTGIINSQGKSNEIKINAEPGEYDYYCMLHPYMKGKLVIMQ